MIVIAMIPDTKPDRAEKFAAQLDDKLKTYATDEARLAFLKGLLRNWEKRYDHFLERVNSRDYVLPTNGPTAFDFANTIAEISVRLSRTECAMQRRA